jgi:type I restriction enzyme R subunit
MLGLNFAYSTNGELIVEFDFITGLESKFYSMPQPSELWHRLKTHEGFTSQQEDLILSPFHLTGGKTPRYYQQLRLIMLSQPL